FLFALHLPNSFSSIPIDLNKPAEVERIVRSCLGTKVTSTWMELAVRIAMSAVKTVETMENGRKEIDIKRYIRIEKVSPLCFLSFHSSLVDSWWRNRRQS